MEFARQSITSNTSFDIIVTGVGSMGASACYYLAKKGYKVLGIEQFDITHELGSHAGQSRIIRKAYFEHPDYVPLLQRAYENWKHLEEETGAQVYYRTGLVYFGQPDNEMLSGVKRSAVLYNIPLDTLSAEERFPQFSLPENFETLFEPDAGFVTPEKAIRLYASQAVKNGAAIHTNEKVIAWRKEGDGIVVTTDKNSYRCAKLIISAGAWSPKIIPAVAEKIKVTRQFVAWVQPKNEKKFLLNNFPCWMIADDTRPGCYYGFPVLPKNTFGEPAGLKIAWHHPGIVTDADNISRQTTEEDMNHIMYLLNNYLPGTFESLVAAKICLYSNTPDENFIIDKLPGFEDHVVIACGFSGHGFKFAPVVGEILAELATDGVTKQPVDFLSAKRFE